jgi:hypothetical protein
VLPYGRGRARDRGTAKPWLRGPSGLIGSTGSAVVGYRVAELSCQWPSVRFCGCRSAELTGVTVQSG